MKHIAVLFALLGMSTMGWAQVDPGTFSVIPHVGLNLSTISDESLVNDVGTMKSKYKAGAVAGVDLEYRISAPFAVIAGAYYSREGCNYKDNVLDHPEVGTYNVLSRSYFTIDYLKIPVMARWYATDKLSVGTGLQAGIGLWNLRIQSPRKSRSTRTAVTLTLQILRKPMSGAMVCAMCCGACL